MCLFLFSTSSISMRFQFTHLYLIEGFKPMCLQVTTFYDLENNLQDYLWPLTVIAKARLTSCSEPFRKTNFLPIRHQGIFVSIGILNTLVCSSGCVFHFVRLLKFYAVGKVCISVVWCLINYYRIKYLWLLESTWLCYEEKPQQAIVELSPCKHANVPVEVVC